MASPQAPVTVGAGSSRADTPSTVTETEGETEVDLDSYQSALEEVLTWLLLAEDTLHMQEDVSDDVEEVKDQFHTHEVPPDAELAFLQFANLSDLNPRPLCCRHSVLVIEPQEHHTMVWAPF